MVLLSTMNTTLQCSTTPVLYLALLVGMHFHPAATR